MSTLNNFESDFSRCCRDREEAKSVLNYVGTYLITCQRRKSQLAVNHIDELNELSSMESSRK